MLGHAVAMTRTIVITGAASGMGRATAEQLTAQGHRIIGVDRTNAAVVADLATPAGRAAMVAQVAALAPDGIDGVVAAAGVAVPAPPELIVAVNYFGVVGTLEGLRPLLLRSANPCAVAIISTAALLDHDAALMAACLDGDEAAAIAAAGTASGASYASSKRALAHWVRQAALSADWGGAGILLNAVAPGLVRTPMVEPFLADAEGREMLAKATPVALAGRTYGEPEELAEAIGFLATLRGRFLAGQILYVDGGTEALLRPGTI